MQTRAGARKHWLELADGVLPTGPASNVHPSRFDQALRGASRPLDPQRKATTLAMIPQR